MIKEFFLVKLVDEDTKHDIISCNKSVRPNGIYINDNLTPIRRLILYVLRKAKKDFPNIVTGCSSINGDLFVWIKSNNASRDRRLLVNNFKTLDKFCSEIIDTTVANYLPDFSYGN